MWLYCSEARVYPQKAIRGLARARFIALTFQKNYSEFGSHATRPALITASFESAHDIIPLLLLTHCKMFALRRSVTRAILSRPSSSLTILHNPRSITTFSTSWRICPNPASMSVLQKRLASDMSGERQERAAEAISSSEQDSLAPETTSAGQFDASDIEAIEAREVPQQEPVDSAAPTYNRRETITDRSQLPPNKQLYVGNLFFDVTEEDLRRELARFGTVTNVKIIKDARGMSKGFAYCDFLEQDEATSAKKSMDGQVFEGRRLTIQYAQPRSLDQVTRERNKLQARTPTPPTRTLYIGNMAFDLSDQDLSKLFSGIKGVLDVRVAIDRRTGQPRGFAHADFTDVESAELAFKKLDGKEVYGRRLKLDFSGPSSRVRPRTGDE